MEALLHGLTAEALAGLCGVHIATARRWRRGETVPAPVARLIELAQHGALGLLDQAWRDWRLVRGRLCGPDGFNFSPGEVLAIPYLHGLIASLKCELKFAAQADWIEGRYVAPRQPQMGVPSKL